MGLLNFLNRRTSTDANFEHPSRHPTLSTTVAALPHTRSTTTETKTLEEWRQATNQVRVTTTIESTVSSPLKPRLIGISEGRPSSAPDDNPQPKQSRLTGRKSRDRMPSLTLNLAPSHAERGRGQRRSDLERVNSLAALPSPLSPYARSETSSGISSRRRSSAFVDLLDAQGDIKPCDFRTRLRASGTRDYGEDVADRNLIENGSGLMSPNFNSVVYLPTPGRGSVSTCSVYRSPQLTDMILEENGQDESADSSRCPSRCQSPFKDSRRRMRKQSSATLEEGSGDMTDDDAQSFRAKARLRSGRISVTALRGHAPQRAPNTSAGLMRDDASSLTLASQSAAPPEVPRYKQRQYSLPTEQPSRTMPGSVRAAREALYRDRSRCASPASAHQLFPHQRPENYHDWSRFQKHPQPPQAWEDTSSSAPSDHSHTFSLTSMSNPSQPKLDEMDKPLRTPKKQGSISSFALTSSDHSSPRFAGARSIQMADTSMDGPQTMLFKEMKFGGSSSRSTRSRGGDSSIAPDCLGPEEDSCGESIFVSPATPVEEEPSATLYNPKALGMGPAGIYDSDVESLREKRGPGRVDGEALLFQDNGFGGGERSLPGLFNQAEALPPSNWGDLPMQPRPTGPNENRENSGAAEKPRPRKVSDLKFTQRERLLALGFDYDTDSEEEYEDDGDEMPEERALMLLVELLRQGNSTATSSFGEYKLDTKTVAKLQNDIYRRKQSVATSRRGSSINATRMARDQ